MWFCYTEQNQSISVEKMSSCMINYNKLFFQQKNELILETDQRWGQWWVLWWGWRLWWSLSSTTITTRKQLTTTTNEQTNNTCIYLCFSHQLKQTTSRLSQEDINLRLFLTEVNNTLLMKVKSKCRTYSKLHQPVGRIFLNVVRI